MKSYPYIILIAISFGIAHFFFRHSPVETEWFVYVGSQMIGGTSILMSWVLYKTTPFNSIGTKLLCASYLILTVVESAMWIINRYTSFWPSSIMFGIIVLFILIRGNRWDLNRVKGDNWSSDGVYIIFKRPANFLTWFFSLFGYGIGSCSISVNGKRFFISRSDRTFKQAPLLTLTSDICFKLNVKDEEELLSDLGKLLGEPFDLVNANCLSILKKPLHKQGITIRTLLPNQYFKQFIK